MRVSRSLKPWKMNYRILYISILSVLLSFNSLLADEHYDELFIEANAAYKSGQYDSAKALYSEIAQNGMISKDLFYNLGNTHFKLGNVPASILFYERALRMDPGDEDVQYNLQIANSMIPDKIEAIEKVFFVSWWNALAQGFSIQFWCVLIIVLLFLGAGLLTFFFVARNPKTRQLGLLGGVAVFFTAAIVFFLAQTNAHHLDKPEAVVFAPSVKVKSEPSLNGSDQFVIHAGLKVEVTDTDGDWSRIKLADGNSGWLPSQSIEEI